MRLFLAAAVGVLCTASASLAQPIYPWCLKAVMGRGWAVDLCYFRTFEHCNQERFRYGTTSFCIVNPEYYFRYGEPTERPRRGRRGSGG